MAKTGRVDGCLRALFLSLFFAPVPVDRFSRSIFRPGGRLFLLGQTPQNIYKLSLRQQKEMEQNKITSQERYIAASAYLFDLGYTIAWLTQAESDFTRFHFEQENKIIKRVLLPGLAVLFGGILWESMASKYLIYAGVLIVIVSFFWMMVGAWHALKGRKKKVI